MSIGKRMRNLIAISREVLEAAAEIPRKQRFKGNHCWKSALLE